MVTRAGTCGWGHPPCGQAAGVRLYAAGERCPAHTPSALAGVPEPDAARYCPPRVCWCGACPGKQRAPITPPGETVTDIRAKASGKRRAGLPAYRDAQRNRRTPGGRRG